MLTQERKYPPMHMRGDLSMKICPSRTVLDHLTSRWGMLVMIALLDGTHRFSELARRIQGVSEKMLAQNLQVLESDGFVRREVTPTIPPRVDYSLTPMGEDVAGHVKSLTGWVEKNLPKVMKAREKVVAKKKVVAL